MWLTLVQVLLCLWERHAHFIVMRNTEWICEWTLDKYFRIIFCATIKCKNTLNYVNYVQRNACVLRKHDRMTSRYLLRIDQVNPLLGLFLDFIIAPKLWTLNRLFCPYRSTPHEVSVIDYQYFFHENDNGCIITINSDHLTSVCKCRSKYYWNVKKKLKTSRNTYASNTYTFIVYRTRVENWEQ